MGLNKSTGNMYSFVNFTWNVIKGQCPHGCSYCYMKRWGAQKPIRFDEKELKTDLGTGNIIFVGSSCDMWGDDIPDDWIRKIISHCEKYDNKYLFQSKNPEKFLDYIDSSLISDKSIFCTTIESNLWYPEIMKLSPAPIDRSMAMYEISHVVDTYVTIEPILDFELDILVNLVKNCNPIQVNIGADTGRNNLPEPSWGKVLQLIEKLEKFTKVKIKPNLARLKGTYND